MNGLATILASVGILLIAGLALGLTDRRGFNPRWLFAGAALVLLNDALLTNLYGLVPDMLGGAWNWQGKLVALGATLAIAVLPMFGWARIGFVLRQVPGSLRSALPVAAIYGALFVGIALMLPNGPSTLEDYAFQLTMPGLEEELFYRGLLLFTLDRAYSGRLRFLGVDWSWGVVLSCMMFGLAHALSHSETGYAFEPLAMALTAIPALLAVWMRLRTGSLLFPVLLHNLSNTLPRLV